MAPSSRGLWRGAEEGSIGMERCCECGGKTRVGVLRAAIDHEGIGLKVLGSMINKTLNDVDDTAHLEQIRKKLINVGRLRMMHPSLGNGFTVITMTAAISGPFGLKTRSVSTVVMTSDNLE